MAAEMKKVPIPRRGVDYRGKIVLAPMVRSGELPSRLLALHYGADLVWGPETVDKSMIGTTRRVNLDTKTIEWTRPSSRVVKPDEEPQTSIIYRLHPTKEAGKHIFQIGTSDPDRAVEAARLVAADVSGIDVNAGCPKPFSTHGGMGAALLRTPDKLCAILEALVKNIAPEFEIGISVKIRLLETPEETEALVRRLCATGITGLTIHCRTTPMRPRERALRGQLKMIANVCHEFGVACLMNGDVETREQGLKLAEEFGADGAMIATAAEKNSSCFRTTEQGGMMHWRDVIDEYLNIAMEIDNRWANTKYLMSQMIPGKERYYQPVVQSKCYADACAALEFPHHLERAKEVDIRLGLDQLVSKKQQKKAKNASAQAAGGQGGSIREDKKKNKKSLSERGVATSSATEATPVALAG
ncbi:dihydrouridine synthase (Dus) domain-containing protein [Sarocladium implicatum]|nr:dihydrouridine synthase (Dus) domain-containing protein [Sarocladium implicatum]